MINEIVDIDPKTRRMVYIFFLLLLLLGLIIAWFIPAQGLSESDLDARAILASAQGLVESRSALDSRHLSEFAANDPRFHSGNNYNLKMVRMMLEKPNLRAEEIGFLDFELARIEYGRRVKLLYLAAVARGYKPPAGPTPMPTLEPTPMSGMSLPTVLMSPYPAYPFPKVVPSTATLPNDKLPPVSFFTATPFQPNYPPPYPTQGLTWIPTSKPAFTGFFEMSGIVEIQALADETGYSIPWYPDMQDWQKPQPGSVRLLGDLGFIRNGCTEEILMKTKGRWMVIGERYPDPNCGS